MDLPVGPVDVEPPRGAIVVALGDDVPALVGAAPAGATFYFRDAGEYRLARPIEPKPGQTFVGAKGAVLDGSREIGEVGREGALFVATGQTQEGRRLATGEPAPGAIRAGYPETLYIDGRPLRPVASRRAVTSGTFYFDYDADLIVFADDPAGRKVEAGVTPAAFASGADGVTISNLMIEQFAAPVQHGAIQGGGAWTIANNEVRLNYGVGIIVSGGSRIVANDVHDNGQMGLGGNGAGILVERNAIHANGFWSGIDVFWEGGGTKFAVTTDLVVRGNHSESNHGFGLWTDIDNVGTLYEGNRVVGNDGGGINHEISYQAVIRDNVLIGNGSSGRGNWLWGAAIQIQNSGPVEITGNRIDMSGGLNGIALIQQDRGTGAFGPYRTAGNIVYGNTLVSRDGAGRTGGAADHDEPGLLGGGNIFEGNRYFMDDGPHWWWGDFPSGDDWEAYRRDTRQDEGSVLSADRPDTSRW
ncbi:hypothetical protein ASG43_05210 [Aureimonas sp. Leaf454]|nr:hypothetical protein ASG43_05210 [Aureimonas sp. Leaf454]